MLASFGGAIFLPLTVCAAQMAPPVKVAHASPPTAVASAQLDFAAMVERYGPAVVNISALPPSDQTDQLAAASSLDNLDPDDPVFALVRATAARPPAQPGVPEPPRVVWGSGSGFIISPDGIVVTTAHVVNRAEQVTVTLTDKRQFKANVLGVDPQSDVALLQIEGGAKLPVVRLGDTSHIRVGERVLTIGAPDGAQNAATSGLISVTPHVLPDGSSFSFLETDIAADPDNSGGPLLDRTGAVIGVNIQVYADTGRFRSLTLAIPIEAALKLRAQLQGQGKVAGASLGVQTQDVDPGLAAAFGLPRATGALVTAVAPAARGGVASRLKPGDVITHVNGRAIEHQAELDDYLSALQPGAKVALTIVRNKRSMMLPAIGTVRSDAGVAVAASVPNEGNALDRLGLTVHGLSEAELRAAGLPCGVMVDTSTGAAASAGIQAGDIVLSVNSELISTRDAMEKLIAHAGKEVALLIQRENARSFVSLAVK